MKPILIPNFSRRNEFIQMLKERGVTIGAEIGTDHGVYARQLCEGIPGMTLICVDPWAAYTEGNQVHTQEEMNQMYQEVQNRLAPHHPILYRDVSMKAVKLVPDNSLDFVFIDSNHSYKYVKEDIEEWTKKVKPGGIVAGHDYKEDKVNNYGVIEAVNEYVVNNHIAPWFVFQKKGLVDCWMFIKQ